MSAPFAMGPALREDIAQGKEGALLKGVACMAMSWITQAGYAPRRWQLIGAASAFSEPPGKGALLAAGLDVLSTLHLSGEGRVVLRDLGLEVAGKLEDGQ